KPEIVKVLLDRGADIKRTTKYGVSVLHATAHHSSTPRTMITFLIENGAVVDSKDIYGSTPLRFATWRKDNDALEVLLEHGADLNHRDIGGSIHSAVILSRDLAKTKICLRQGTLNLSEPEWHGKSVLDLLAECRPSIAAEVGYTPTPT